MTIRTCSLLWKLALSVLLLPATSMALQTQTQSFTASIAPMQPNWNESVTLPRFDPALGQLQSVRVTLEATLTGYAAFESMDSQPSTVTLEFSAVTFLFRPDNSILSTVSPSQFFVTQATGWDGISDLAGTSGMTFPNLALSESSVSLFLPSTSDFALFEGLPGNPGEILLPIATQGNSTGIGAGGLLAIFSQQASATVEVLYTYEYDCDGDGTTDADEILLGALDSDMNGIPDECEFETVSFTDSFPLALTNWNDSFLLDRFDPALGSLTAARFTCDASLLTQVRVESLDASPTNVTADILSPIEVYRPGGVSLLTTVTPQQSLSFPLAAFDGTLDFAGPSGADFPGLNDNQSSVVTSPPPVSDLALLTGPAGNPGMNEFPVFASGAANIGGAGPLTISVQIETSASLSVEYTYRIDCDGDGVSDLEEIRNGASDFDENGIPDECESFSEFCFGDGGDLPGCTPCPCVNDAPSGASGGCLNSSNRSARLQVSGVAMVGSDTLRFEVTDAVPLSFGILVSANNRLPNMGPCPAGSGVTNATLIDGLRCVGGAALRHGTRGTDMNGDAGVTNHGWGFGSGPPGGLVAASGFMAGQTRHFQCFYRDDFMTVCQSGQNTTQAVSVTFF